MRAWLAQFFHCLLKTHRMCNEYISGPPFYKDILTWRGCECGKTFYGKRISDISRFTK